MGLYIIKKKIKLLKQACTILSLDSLNMLLFFPVRLHGMIFQKFYALIALFLVVISLIGIVCSLDILSRFHQSGKFLITEALFHCPFHRPPGVYFNSLAGPVFRLLPVSHVFSHCTHLSLP